MACQLDLFKNTRLDELETLVIDTRQRTENIRRGLFARHNELAKLYYELLEDHEALKKQVNELKAEKQSVFTQMSA